MRGSIKQITKPIRSFLADIRKGETTRDDCRHWSYERLTYDVLRAERTLDLATLIDRVADQAMHAEQTRGGFNVDIAVWGPSVFRHEADAAVRRMIGQTLVLEAAGPGILVAPMVRAPFAAPKPAMQVPRALGLS